MRTSLPLLAAVLAGAGSAAYGQQPLRQPAGPSPQIVVVVEFAPERGELVVEETRAEQVVVLKTTSGEKPDPARKAAVVTRNVTSRTKHRLDQSEFYSVGGNKLTDAEVRKRLTPGTVLLVSAVQKLGDPYRSVLRDDVLILVSHAPVVPPPVPDPKPLPPQRNP